MQINMDRNGHLYGDPSKKSDESLEAISLEDMDLYMDEIDDWDEVEEVEDIKDSAPLIDPIIKEDKVSSKKKEETSFKKRLQNLKRANADLIEKTKKEIEVQIVDFDASTYVLSKDTKSFVIEVLKKEGLEVTESSKGYEINLDF